MLKNIGRFLSKFAEESGDSSTEAFGETRLPRALGAEILRGSAERRNFVQGIRDSLASMSREEKDELVDRLLARLALFVFDLPASQHNHHSRRFGLLDHLLEVAFHTAKELSGPGFEVSPEPSVNHREGPRWAYAGVVAAIAHDIGKPLDLEVIAPGSAECWDPRHEPLRLFCERHGIAETGPELWHFRSGRGMRSHEAGIGALLPTVLTPEVATFLGPRLSSVIQALTSEEAWARTSGVPEPARQVVRVVRRLDQATSIADSERAAGDVSRPKQTPAAGIPPEDQPVADAGARITPESNAPISPELPELIPAPPAYIPSDLWEERVPKPKVGRGDPAETERKLSHLLEPSRFLELLRRMIVRCRLPRNGLYSELYVRPDYVWLVIPSALRRIARINHLPFDTQVLERMLASLRAAPQVEPGDERSIAVYVKVHPDSGTLRAVKIKTTGFLSEGEVAALGVHQFEVKVISAGLAA